MNLLLTLLAQFLRCLVMLCRKDGLSAVVAQNLLLTQQLIILNRGRERGPNISPLHRILLGFFAFFLSKQRLKRAAVAFKPNTIIRFRDYLARKKHHILLFLRRQKKSGPKGPSPEIIEAVLEFKRRNPRCGCPRIAQQVSATFGIDLHPDVVRRILIKNFKPLPDSDGRSWLTFLGHTKDSLWSIDFFTTQSALLKSYTVMVVMDLFSRRIIGFAVQPGPVDGEALCRMFREITSHTKLPKYLSLDNDPLYHFERWIQKLDSLEINLIHSVPFTPISHPFFERLIGTVRREYLDQLLFWISRDLQHKLFEFQEYFNEHRVHAGIDGDLPNRRADEKKPKIASLENYSWESHCNGLFQIPKAA